MVEDNELEAVDRDCRQSERCFCCDKRVKKERAKERATLIRCTSKQRSKVAINIDQVD